MVFAHVLLLALHAADAGVTELPPVDVPLPPEDLALPTAPTVRDATGTLTTRDATSARPEAKDAAELINTTPGVTVQDLGGAGQRKTVSLRGAASNAVLVLLDGVPLASPGSAMDLSRIPTAALERIEVLRGGVSGRYGPGAMGGVINLVSRSPGERPRVFADFTGGSFVTTQLTLGATSGLFGGDALVLMNGLRSEGRFDFRYDDQPAFPGNTPLTLTRDNNGTLQGGALARFRRRFGATQLDVMLEGNTERRGLAGPVQNPAVDAWQRTGRGTLSVRTQTGFDAGGTLSTLAWGRLDDSTLSGTLFGTEYRQLESAAGGEVVYTHLVGRHGLTALVSGGVESLREPLGKNPTWGRLGALVADDLLFFDGAFTVSPSVRVDLAGPFFVFSPKLGALLELPLGFSLRANAGQSSRAPSFSELYVVQGTLLPNTSLQPERALTADLGAAWKHEKGRVSATGFSSLYENLISYEYYPPNLSRPYNFAAASVVGLEVEASTTPFTWLEASASYTFLHTQNLRDDPRYYLKALPFRPAHRLHTRIAAGPDWLKARAELVFQSAQFTNRTQTLSVPDRALVNLGVTVTPSQQPRISLSAELKNLLDVQTWDYDGYPLPPRAFFVTLGVSWEPNPSRDSVKPTR
ncbi:MAG: ligand-gated channel protein [Archangium gephyra]|uniref:Ligand-gated channel protein n=1 Tax=Archangium gephyra TaxID=48 RepID=A0A2W5UQ19_9BACT|nr:MAG: ligand-gated channel protein [Archangium gephyra]